MPWSFFTNAGKEKAIEETTPAGLIIPFAGAIAPSGWLLCLGQEVARASYPKLDAAIGTIYGTYTNGAGASGTTHMRLPDLRGRTAVGCHAGAGNRTDTNGPLTGTGQVTGGSTMAAASLGAWSGTESVTLSAAESGIKQHNHGASVSSHSHSVTNTSHAHSIGFGITNRSTGATTRAVPDGGNPLTYGSGGSGIGASSDTKSSGYNTTRSSSAVAASAAHTNMTASLVLNFMIRAI